MLNDEAESGPQSRVVESRHRSQAETVHVVLGTLSGLCTCVIASPQPVGCVQCSGSSLAQQGLALPEPLLQDLKYYCTVHTYIKQGHTVAVDLAALETWDLERFVEQSEPSRCRSKCLPAIAGSTLISSEVRSIALVRGVI